MPKAKGQGQQEQAVAHLKSTTWAALTAKADMDRFAAGGVAGSGPSGHAAASQSASATSVREEKPWVSHMEVPPLAWSTGAQKASEHKYRNMKDDHRNIDVHAPVTTHACVDVPRMEEVLVHMEQANEAQATSKNFANAAVCVGALSGLQ